MATFTRTMPKQDDFVINEYHNDPEWAKYRIAIELKDYGQTGKIKHLLSTLHSERCAGRQRLVQLAKEIGFGRVTLYDTLNGKN